MVVVVIVVVVVVSVVVCVIGVCCCFPCASKTGAGIIIGFTLVLDDKGGGT